ncbi:MAG: hypothetical protein ACKVXR_00155 [Planctomycetota bacterium]
MKLVALAITLFASTTPAARAQDQRPEPRQERDDAAEARTIAQKAAQFEKAYRDRAARIDRLQAIYKKEGAETKLVELREMRARLDKRHANAMQGFRKQLGEERWAKVEKHLGGPSARALEVRNERANENAAERDARKAQKEAEGKEPKPPRTKEREDKPKDKPKDS